MFSARSRKRLLQTFHRLDSRCVANRPIFMTLTYPGVWPDSPTSWKTQLKNYWKRITRLYPKASCIWRLESQERGAPHFHLIVFNVPWLDLDQVSRAWYEVVGSNDPNHLQQGIDLTFCQSWNQAGRYVAKYAAKVDSRVLILPWGRFWGIMGREHLAMNVTTCKVSEHEYYAIRRLQRRWLSGRVKGRVQCRGDCGMWVFMPWDDAVRAISDVLRASDADERAAVFEGVHWHLAPDRPND